MVHSVSVGLDATEGEKSRGPDVTEVSLDIEAADEPVLVGEPVESVVVGQELSSSEGDPAAAPAATPSVSAPAPNAH